MPQEILPLIPAGSTSITDILNVLNKDGYWYYFLGSYEIFSHKIDDMASFRFISSTLVYTGRCKTSDIINTFGVSTASVKRWLRRYKDGGPSVFFCSRPVRGAAIMTAEIISKSQELLNSGFNRQSTADRLGIKKETLRKSIERGELLEHSDTINVKEAEKTRTERQLADSATSLGMACTRTVERILSAVGIIRGTISKFERCLDVSFGGSLLGIPALVANGLTNGIRSIFSMKEGYYSMLQLFVLLGIMALCRIKTIEQLKYESPGELGKLIGLDRIPEVRCLRKKLKELSKNDAAFKWQNVLKKYWLDSNPNLAGILYVDGHVRVYHGKSANVPKHYVSRERLCLKGITDYWINDAIGQPFFLVEKVVDNGLIQTLKNEIVPQLISDVPNQPTADELHQNPYLHRFMLIFDREGYSPDLFKELWEKYRIACITYHKFPGEKWPESFFNETIVHMPNGEKIKMKLAEMGTFLAGKIWVREIRRLKKNGHQTSILTTAYTHLTTQTAAYMFSRWSQENFFKYMMQHYAIEALCQYETKIFTDTIKVVNPAWRRIERNKNSLVSKLNRRKVEYASLSLKSDADSNATENIILKKTELVEEIELMEKELEGIQIMQRKTDKHIPADHLEGEDIIIAPVTPVKTLTDAIKMIAYRAETRMAAILKEKLSNEDEARALIREIMRTPANIIPDVEKLKIQLHPMSTQRANRAVEYLIDILNETKTMYPGTTLKLSFEMLGKT